MYIFLLVVALCSKAVLSQVQVPCYGEGCANVAVYLGPRWGSRVINIPSTENLTHVETKTTEEPMKSSDDRNHKFHPQHKPIPPGDEFRVNLMDDEPREHQTQNQWLTTRNYNARWFWTTRRPWNYRATNFQSTEYPAGQIVVDDRGTLDLSWRGYTGEDVKRLLNSLSKHERSKINKLVLDGNLIKYLPVLVFPVELEYSLRELSLNNNPINPPFLEYVTRFELSRLDSLKVLNMTHCGLEYLTLPYLPSLEVLDLSSNRLTYLPLGLGRLSNLSKLFLRDNRISYIDNSPLSTLSYLRVLDLGSNGLREFWGEPLEHLRFLITLNLDNNRLTSLPQLDFSRTKTLTLDNNTLQCSCSLVDWVYMLEEFKYDFLARCRDGDRSVYLRDLQTWPERYQHLCDAGWWGSRFQASLALRYSRSTNIINDVYKVVGVLIVVALLVFLLKRRRIAAKEKPKGIPYNILDEQRVSTVSGPLVDV